MTELNTEPYNGVQTIKNIVFPEELKYRSLLVTGPPGSGKSSLIRQLGGWSEEGYVDLAMNKWWTAQSLSLRPREVHLGIPFQNHKESLAVFEPAWIESYQELEIDFKRIANPEPKRYFFSVDWYKRYAFEFLLPPAEIVFQRRMERAKKRTHYVDETLTLQLSKQQRKVYAELAKYLCSKGFLVYIREDINQIPLKINPIEP